MSPQDLLQSVNDFYQQAWDKLIIYTTILIAIVGIIIPIILTWWQNKTLRIQEETIRNKLWNSFDNKLKEMEEILDKKTEEILGNCENEIGKYYGHTLHLQGQKNVASCDYKNALIDFCAAGKRILKGNDYLNIQRINDNIKTVLEEIIPEELIEVEEEENQPTRYFKQLSENNKNGIFTDYLREMNKILAKKKK